MSDIWAPPDAEVKDADLSHHPRAAEIRRRHIIRELAIKAVGMLYYIGAAVVTSLIAYATITDGLRHQLAVEGLLLAAAFLGASMLAVATGRGLRKLTPWGRILCGLISLPGLLQFPMGTVISGFILYLLYSPKGNMVFSGDYQQIVADTPEVKSRMAIVVWIVLALVVAAIALAGFSFFRRAGIVY